MKPTILFILLAILFGSCKEQHKPTEQQTVQIDTLQGFSLINVPLIRRQIDLQRDSLQVANYLKAKDEYSLDSNITENHIWLGRRIAYLGDYKKAIAIYTEALQQFPEDPRLYRHRGHRYISLRQLDKAIADFDKAVELIKGTEDSVEPDGIPNRLNQPVSSLHTNIWYHLGLAYYLQNDMTNALAAFHECLLASKNDDMIVASSHWLYMILRRMQLPEEAENILTPINADMNIIENMVYHKLLLFYKGELQETDLLGDGSIGANEAITYGLGNWHHYNNNIEKATTIYTELLSTGNWAAFGYIAAEADLSRVMSDE